MKLQAVFFDMGGTLDTYRQTRDFRIANAHLIREILTKAAIPFPWSDEKLVDAISAGMAAYYAWNYDSKVELPPEQIWSRFVLDGLNYSAELLAPVGEDLAFTYETQLYIREMKAEVPGVLAKIKALGLQMGIISNTQSRKQVPYNLKQYGIASYFDPVVLSSEYGRRKPDPSIFYHAARLANLPTGACIYVGDMINKDILGAQRAGYRSAVQIIHIYAQSQAEPLAAPDAVIENLDELIPILEAEIEMDSRPAAIHNNKKVKAIFFDAGDVLYYRPEKEKKLREFLAGVKHTPQPDFDAEAERLKDLAYSGKIKRHAYYTEILHLYGISDPDLILSGIEAMRLDDETVEILDGVPETIIHLKEEGFILGIITDTALPVTNKLTWFDRHGFGHVWDSVISSRELGVRKPSPILYQSAIEQTGIRPREAVFVGHKASELQGARAIGMRTVAFNYEDGAAADFYIDHFSELLNVPFIKG